MERDLMKELTNSRNEFLHEKEKIFSECNRLMQECRSRCIAQFDRPNLVDKRCIAQYVGPNLVDKLWKNYWSVRPDIVELENRINQTDFFNSPNYSWNPYDCLNPLTKLLVQGIGLYNKFDMVSHSNFKNNETDLLYDICKKIADLAKDVEHKCVNLPNVSPLYGYGIHNIHDLKEFIMGNLDNLQFNLEQNKQAFDKAVELYFPNPEKVTSSDHKVSVRQNKRKWWELCPPRFLSRSVYGDSRDEFLREKEKLFSECNRLIQEYHSRWDAQLDGYILADEDRLWKTYGAIRPDMIKLENQINQTNFFNSPNYSWKPSEYLNPLTKYLIEQIIVSNHVFGDDEADLFQDMCRKIADLAKDVQHECVSLPVAQYSWMSPRIFCNIPECKKFISEFVDKIKLNLDRNEQAFDKAVEMYLSASESLMQSDRIKEPEPSPIPQNQSEDVVQEVQTVEEKAPEVKTAIADSFLNGLLSMSHLIIKNPILLANGQKKQEYLSYLQQCIELGKWQKDKYVSAQMNVYDTVLRTEYLHNCQVEQKWRYFLLLDLLHILGFSQTALQSEGMKKVKDKFLRDFPCMQNETRTIDLIFDALNGNFGNWSILERNPILSEQHEYLKLIEQNLTFLHTKPLRILVTATMSAGKSTFINALTGKQIALSQNMACTSKIHSIMGKAFEDGFCYEYDHDLVLMAGKEELLENNQLNQSDDILVSTYYQGLLGGERLIIYDSPGVNYSGDATHQAMTRRLIESHDYDLLIYLMNSTQLGTNDDKEHLEYVRSQIGDTPILFVMNKIDTINPEEEDVHKIIANVVQYIQDQGFQNPMVCPVSSHAAYLAKSSQGKQLSRSEYREIDRYLDKFAQMRLLEYYQKNYPNVKISEQSSDEELDLLLKCCGISYIETILQTFCIGFPNWIRSPTKKLHVSAPTVHVIATMSSGKSTLINALLAHKLIPSKNEACTATITEILDNDGKGFSAKAYDENDELIETVHELTYREMTRLNENEKVNKIEAQGNIPFWDFPDSPLKVIDTPGPINSKNDNYQETIRRAIKDTDKLILYVLNGTFFGCNDENIILDEISTQMTKGGQQVRDRFLFVINKMDGFDPEEEDIDVIIQTAKAYLGSFGIEDPKVFPCSAFTALNIRQYLQGINIETMTREEERQLPAAARNTIPMIYKFIDHESMHLEQYATLPPSVQRDLNKRLEQAQKDNNLVEQALIHCGIYPIEAAITTYFSNLK